MMKGSCSESGDDALLSAVDDLRAYAQDLEADTIQTLLTGITVGGVHLASLEPSRLLAMRDSLLVHRSFVRLAHESRRAAFRACMIELFLREYRLSGE